MCDMSVTLPNLGDRGGDFGGYSALLLGDEFEHFGLQYLSLVLYAARDTGAFVIFAVVFVDMMVVGLPVTAVFVIHFRLRLGLF